MTKKILLAAALAGMLTFAGCSGTNTTTTAPKSQPEKVVEQPEPAPRTWNTEDLNPMTNGNILYAVELVRGRSGDLALSAQDADPVAVMRRPWDYYGQVLSFSGTVAVVQDQPPGHNISKAFGGDSCEIVMENNGVIIDGLLSGNSDGVYVGDWVTFYGYPCGILEVDNKIGGKFSHLIVIGTR